MTNSRSEVKGYGLMSNFTEALTNAARSATCQLLGLPQYLNDMTTRLSGGTFTPPLSQIPNLWRRALCDTDAPPVPPPPFSGGQCPVVYNVQMTYAGQRALISGSCVSSNGQTGGNILGPITIAGRRREGPDDGFVLRQDFRDGNGQTVTLSTALFSESCGGGSITGITATRVDGLPDNCGNPPVVIPPLQPDDTRIPRDVTYNNNAGVAVTIPVLFVFARAQVDVNANITIPFTLNLSPTLNITGVINVDGQVQFNFGGGTATSLPKDPRKGDCDDIPFIDDEDIPDPTDSDQPDQPERDREETIIGVLVTVTALSNERATLIVQNDNPDIYAPSLGFVNFLCRVGTISAGWTADIPVKNRRHLIQCPWDQGAIAVRGTPQRGVSWTLTPVYGYAGIPVDYVTA